MNMKTIIKHIIPFLFAFCAVSNGFTQTTTKVVITSGYPSAGIKSAVEKNISVLLNNLAKAYEEDGTSLNLKSATVSEEANEAINDIWSSAKFYCTKTEIREILIKTSTGYQVRNIPVSVAAEDEEEQEQEIVIELDKKGIIKDLHFSLNYHQYQNVMTANGVVDKTRREIILNFMEMLKTAYMRKDLKFIDDVFSEKALIIVGKTVQKTDKPVLTMNSNKETFARQSTGGTVYTKLTKQEYLAKLKTVFTNNKSIQLKFEDIEVERHSKEGYESFYGVHLKQHWKADAYKDYGLMFFLIQFRENDHPLIWVRTWQDANTTNESDKIGMGDFRIRPE